jgi:hypothetical protein
MLIQLLQLTAILGAIALAPRLVTVELTNEGDDLWQWTKDRATDTVRSARRALLAGAIRLKPLFPGLLPTAPGISDIDHVSEMPGWDTANFTERVEMLATFPGVIGATQSADGATIYAQGTPCPDRVVDHSLDNSLGGGDFVARRDPDAARAAADRSHALVDRAAERDVNGVLAPPMLPMLTKAEIAERNRAQDDRATAYQTDGPFFG